MATLSGKIALVTGSGSGIGAAIAKRFAVDGATVWVADLNAAGAAATVAAITASGGKAIAIELNVTDESSCKSAIERVNKESGKLDALVNCAGIGMVGTILDTSGDDLDRLWNVNVKGMFYLCKAVLPGMIAAKKGSIVNIGSIASEMGMYDRFAYTTTKHAVAGLTRAMAMDCGETGVRVNCICPGRVDTPFVQQRLREYPEPEKFMAQMVAPHLNKRLAQPEEIAAAASFLASDDSSFSTGSLMFVDGGYTTGK